MAILQAYQADVLKEMDEGAGLTPEAVKELRRATDLALRATKHTARAVGRSMAASVAAECHLWLNLTEIREKEKVFLMDAPISQSGLFGEAVSAMCVQVFNDLFNWLISPNYQMCITITLFILQKK